VFLDQEEMETVVAVAVAEMVLVRVLVPDSIAGFAENFVVAPVAGSVAGLGPVAEEAVVAEELVPVMVQESMVSAAAVLAVKVLAAVERELARVQESVPVLETKLE
jgi:hypothetical protein